MRIINAKVPGKGHLIGRTARIVHPGEFLQLNDDGAFRIGTFWLPEAVDPLQLQRRFSLVRMNQPNISRGGGRSNGGQTTERPEARSNAQGCYWTFQVALQGSANQAFTQALVKFDKVPEPLLQTCAGRGELEK